MNSPPPRAHRFAPLVFAATIVSLGVVSFFLWQAEQKRTVARLAQAEVLRQNSYVKGREDANRELARPAATSAPPGETKPAATAETAAASIAVDAGDHKLVLVIAAILSLVFTIFGFVILLGKYPEDTKKWATGILGTIIGFWLGVPKT